MRWSGELRNVQFSTDMSAPVFQTLNDIYSSTVLSGIIYENNYDSEKDIFFSIKYLRFTLEKGILKDEMKLL